jgi:hypothetical protein
MAPRRAPDQDVDQIEFIRSFRPSGSSTVVSMWDVGEGARLPMLRWGNAIYCPVYEGMRFGVEVYNGRDSMVAYPTYVEGANLWSGGPAEPEDCLPSHMWEISPGQVLRFDALMNPAGQRGRPIVITQTGMGATVGEATFGTTEHRGQLRIYERMPEPQLRLRSEAAHMTRAGVVHDERTMSRHLDGDFERAAPVSASAGPEIDDYVASPAPLPEAAAPLPAGLSPPPAALSPAAGAAPRAVPPRAPGAAAPAPMPARAQASTRLGPAGFGAGEEEERRHHFTGVNYLRPVHPVVFLRTEFRDDLDELLRAKLGTGWGWRWPEAWGATWREEPWMWPVPPTAPQVPVTRPVR